MIRNKHKSTRKTDFNWQELRDKMDRMAASLTMKLDETKLAAVLAERAEQLANDVETDQFEQTIDVLIFDLGEEQYAIDTSYVSEVIPLKLVTRVPGAPDFILGVVSRRGEIISVIDLGKFLHLHQAQPNQQLIFIEAFGNSVGLAVHRLKEITRLTRDSIQTLQSQLSGEQGQFLAGVTETGTALLNIEEVMSNERLNIDQQ